MLTSEGHTTTADTDIQMTRVHQAIARQKAPCEQGTRSIPLFDGNRKLGWLAPVTGAALTDNRAISRLARWREAAADAYPAVFPVTIEGTRRWLENGVLNQPDRMLFWVIDDTGRPVGHAGFYRYDTASNSIEIDNVVRGVSGPARGIMTLAVRALCAWAFENLHVDSLCLRVFDDNPRAIRLYRATGFQEMFRLPLVCHEDLSGRRWMEAGPTHRGPVGRHFVTMRLSQGGQVGGDPRRQSRRDSRPVLSIVMPAKNEAGTLARAHAELGAVLDTLGEPYEVLLVDNASTDATPMLAREICDRDSRWRYLRFSRDFGVETSMAVGLRAAVGDAAMVIFSDLQDPVELIPRFVHRWREGHDVVYGVVQGRAGDPWWKSLGSKLFYGLMERVGDCHLPARATDFRLLSRRALDAMAKLDERNRYFRGLSHWIGFPSCAIAYDRHPRKSGKSHAPFFYLLNLATRAVTSFSLWPVEALGLLAALSGGFTLVLALLATLGIWGVGLLHTLLGGMLTATLASGFVVGQYAARTYLEARRRPLYLTQESIRWNQAETARGYWTTGTAPPEASPSPQGRVPGPGDTRERPAWAP